MEKTSEVYSGALAEPLKPRFMWLGRKLRRLKRPLGTLGMNGSTSPTPLPEVFGKPSRVPRWRAEYDNKIPLLMQDYGINKEDPKAKDDLIRCLVVAHVPGFQEKARRKGGRKRTVSCEEEAKLYYRFCQLRQSGHSGRNAAGLMAKESKKAGRLGSSGPSILRRMQRHAQEAKKSAAALESWNAVLATLAQNPAP